MGGSAVYILKIQCPKCGEIWEHSSIRKLDLLHRLHNKVCNNNNLFEPMDDTTILFKKDTQYAGCKVVSMTCSMLKDNIK
jgi:hypothetical protein